jgi:hypothetical protein
MSLERIAINFSVQMIDLFQTDGTVLSRSIQLSLSLSPPELSLELNLPMDRFIQLKDPSSVRFRTAQAWAGRQCDHRGMRDPLKDSSASTYWYVLPNLNIKLGLGTVATQQSV